ncbi:MAG: TetR family transcriptional regulator [Saprospiraceae bacterium]|nr:MAG: TetR family transcriptional regulator [Saprospiraceae bacterium]
MEVKQQILIEAADLFMRYGLKSVSMDDIARKLGISKKTLYQYVENKTELIEQIFSLKFEEDSRQIKDIRLSANDAIDEVLKIAKHVIQHLRELSPTTIYDLQKYYSSTWKQFEAQHKGYIFTLICDNLIRGIKQGLYRSELNPEIVAKLYVGKTSLVVDEDVFPIQQFNLDDLYREHMIYHIYGVASPKGRAILERYLQNEFGTIH